MLEDFREGGFHCRPPICPISIFLFRDFFPAVFHRQMKRGKEGVLSPSMCVCVTCMVCA